MGTAAIPGLDPFAEFRSASPAGGNRHCGHHAPAADNDAGARVKFAAVAGRVLDLLNDDKLLSPLDSAVIPLPHQIRALRRVVANPGKVRYLMADEVGLGKTIEAGLAIRELKLRGMVKRVLVVAPKGLIPQWIVEMRERFGEDFRHFDPGPVRRLPENLAGGKRVEQP